MSEEQCQPSDIEVLGRIQEGDVDSFIIILERYRKTVLQIVTNRIPDREVEEVSQDVFVRAYQSLPSFKGNVKFPNWLARIALRTCYDYWRRHYRSRERAIGSFSQEQQRWLDEVTSNRSQQDFNEGEVSQEAREVLDLALAELKPAERLVLELVYLEGHSLKETAELLDWSSTKVRVCSHRSRKKLRSFLRELLNSES